MFGGMGIWLGVHVSTLLRYLRCEDLYISISVVCMHTDDS